MSKKGLTMRTKLRLKKGLKCNVKLSEAICLGPRLASCDLMIEIKKTQNYLLYNNKGQPRNLPKYITTACFMRSHIV